MLAFLPDSVTEALFHVCGNDCNASLFHGGYYRRQLCENIGARGFVFNQSLESPHLSFDPFQTADDFSFSRFHFHSDTPWGYNNQESFSVKAIFDGNTSCGPTYFLDKRGVGGYIPFRQYRGGPMKEFIKVMKALSDPNRVKLLKLIQQRTMCVCEIQTALGIAQPTVSKHLKILEEAGLVGREKEGLWVNYFLSDGAQSPYAASLLGNLRHWLHEDSDIRDLIARSQNIRREDLCHTHP
jgi:ArsR family transcriptional regulator